VDEAKDSIRYFRNFKTNGGNAQNAPLADVLEYDKNTNLSSQQAAALYNGNPRVKGSELSKATGTQSATHVIFDSKPYAHADSTGIINAKTAKLAREPSEKALLAAKTAAISTIKSKMINDPGSKPDIDNTALKTRYNELNSSARIADDKT